jgi:hypothetical protein
LHLEKEALENESPLEEKRLSEIDECVGALYEVILADAKAAK